MFQGDWSLGMTSKILYLMPLNRLDRLLHMNVVIEVVNKENLQAMALFLNFLSCWI